ncbi:PIN domain-containing protein [Duganella sp. FT50W]|uniref:PIN domain-containing protein n=1 Tax=Duganella lactea TaxID=2692173 RepID=A0A6L8MQF8_9BURK|nr:PIN domain-containing protein [Duganella lactea]MYM82558.1 PIN domain-containing protein [Duganella lactea]
MIMLDTQSGSIVVSAFSLCEVALLVEYNRLWPTPDFAGWQKAVEAIDRLRFIPVDHHIAVSSVQLTAGLHKDPADRIIVATARLLSTRADDLVAAYFSSS